MNIVQNIDSQTETLYMTLMLKKVQYLFFPKLKKPENNLSEIWNI